MRPDRVVVVPLLIRSLADVPKPPTWVFTGWPPPWQMPELAPHVFGMVHDDGDTIWVGWVHTAPQGEGHGGRWLDSLPTDRRIAFIHVLFEPLRSMLDRRGFSHRFLFAHEGELIDGWARPKT